jgi:uncharacterized protein (UPF0305 family)
MKTPPRIVALPVLFASLLLGQALRLVPDIAVAEAEYRDAQQAWIENDPTLEKDLYKGNPEEMRRRIHRAAALADDVMVKKEAYFSLFVQRLEDMRAKLNQTQDPGMPTEALKKDLDEQQTRLLGDQDRLELLLRDLPPGDEYLLVRRQLEGERSDLVNAQNNIAMRIRSLDNIDKAQQSTQGSQDFAAKMDEILKVWEQERASVERQRPAYARLYQLYEESLGKPSAAGTPKTAAAVAPAPSKSKAAPAARTAAPVTSPAAGQAGISGVWTYASQPGGWTGYGEPEMVKLDLRIDAGGAVRGTYAARLPVHSGVSDVELSLEGQAKPAAMSAQVHWRSQTPAAEGEMEIKVGSDGRMLLERTQSSDSYIPCGMEVLLRH